MAVRDFLNTVYSQVSLAAHVDKSGVDEKQDTGAAGASP